MMMEQRLKKEISASCVLGVSLAMGYYNNPEATKKAFIINPLNKKYLQIIYETGDLVSRSDELYYFKGRADPPSQTSGL